MKTERAYYILTAKKILEGTISELEVKTFWNDIRSHPEKWNKYIRNWPESTNSLIEEYKNAPIEDITAELHHQISNESHNIVTWPGRYPETRFSKKDALDLRDRLCIHQKRVKPDVINPIQVYGRNVKGLDNNFWDYEKPGEVYSLLEQIRKSHGASCIKYTSTKDILDLSGRFFVYKNGEGKFTIKSSKIRGLRKKITLCDTIEQVREIVAKIKDTYGTNWIFLTTTSPRAVKEFSATNNLNWPGFKEDLSEDETQSIVGPWPSESSHTS